MKERCEIVTITFTNGFATETVQKLTDFFSDDELGEDIDPSALSSVRKKDKKIIPSSKKC